MVLKQFCDFCNKEISISQSTYYIEILHKSPYSSVISDVDDIKKEICPKCFQKIKDLITQIQIDNQIQI